MHRHLERSLVPGVTHGCAEGLVDGVALRGAGQVHHGVSDRELALGAAQAFVHLPRIQGQLQRARIRLRELAGDPVFRDEDTIVYAPWGDTLSCNGEADASDP